ncbi:MAG: MarR family transcriptional regulator [Acidimicrobiia bacterium]|nr:MAG: MarR family transcriptional regulator [Acidimicrobiia bacterium]
MTESLEAGMVDTWRGFLFAHAKVVRALEADMIEQHGLPITWFDLLGRIKQAPGQRLRMHQLEEASLFTRSGITGLADRLEKAGFVRRERSAEDRRGVYLAITQSGIDKIDEVWPDHEVSIQNHFGQYLDQEGARALQAITEKILNPGAE